MVVYTLEGIFIILLIILLFATATCWAIEQFNPFMLFTIPGVIIAIFILTMCIATPSPPTVAEPGHYCCDRAGSYGYLDDGKVTYVIPQVNPCLSGHGANSLNTPTCTPTIQSKCQLKPVMVCDYITPTSTYTSASIRTNSTPCIIMIGTTSTSTS